MLRFWGFCEELAARFGEKPEYNAGRMEAGPSRPPARVYNIIYPKAGGPGVQQDLDAKQGAHPGVHQGVQ